MDEEQLENSNVPKQLQPHVYRKGQSGNPNGRPKGSVSLKTYAKQMIEQMTPEEREEFLEGLPKQFIWEMAEGKAQSTTDLTTNGQPINIVVPPIVAETFNLNATTNTETGGVPSEQEQI